MCLQVNKSDEQSSAISFLQLSDCCLLTHISARMFPFTALFPFPVQQKCATLFQFVEHGTFLPAAAVSPRSTFCMKNRYVSSPCPRCPINAHLHRSNEFMWNASSLVLLLSIFLVTPEGTLEWNQCFFSPRSLCRGGFQNIISSVFLEQMKCLLDYPAGI